MTPCSYYFLLLLNLIDPVSDVQNYDIRRIRKTVFDGAHQQYMDPDNFIRKQAIENKIVCKLIARDEGIENPAEVANIFKTGDFFEKITTNHLGIGIKKLIILSESGIEDCSVVVQLKKSRSVLCCQI